MSSSDYEILGIGTPILDNVLCVSNDFVAALQGKKGGMEPVTFDEFTKIIVDSSQPPLLIPGGSTANTLKGLASLGEKSAFFGKIGNDEAGGKFQQGLRDAGIISLLHQTTMPTAQVLCLLTPDNERTCRSFLGAGLEMNPDDLHKDLFKGVKLVHMEGFVLLYDSFAIKAMQLAKEAGAKVSFTLGSFEVVERYKERIINLLANHVDILFANSKEVQALTRLDPDKGCNLLKDLCETVVVTMGEKGCWAANKNEKIYQTALKVTPIDTTGAGDLFASGFLHGYLAQKPLLECTLYGTRIAGEVVQVLGAEIPSDIWSKLKIDLYKD